MRRRIKCPRCHGTAIKIHEDKIAEIILTDLVFTKRGCKRRTTRYYGCKIRCIPCKEYYAPKRLRELKSRRYGDGFVAWCVYQRVVCRIPYRIISRIALDIYGIDIAPSMVQILVTRMGDQYNRTVSEILRDLLKSPALHIDDTRVPTLKEYAYVWSITNGELVLFIATLSREPGPVLEKLKGYNGVLVSDFFAGFDSVPFKQQKCWAHLIKDHNDILWKEPFNSELEAFVNAGKELIVPIIKKFNRFGPKKYHLMKFNKNIDIFFKNWIYDKDYSTETVKRFQKRFMRYRKSLFTFVNEDGVPWHNNAGERALRHVAVQRKISTGPFSMTSLPQYLILLSIAQSCRFLDKSFLEFLLSGKRGIYALLKTRKSQLSS